VKALVIGLGHMGHFHARVLADLGYTITTVDPAGHADHRTVPGWTWDLAAVATPVQALIPNTIALLRHGTPTLVEKPVSTRLADIHRLCAIQQRTGTPCAVGLVERFNPRVLELKAHLERHTTRAATFTRINDRPSWNVPLDLQLHDIDLAHHLGLHPMACTYRTHANATHKVRRIDTATMSVDLTAHHQSPLHGLWQAFIAGTGYPSLDDAITAHETLTALQARVFAEAA